MKAQATHWAGYPGRMLMSLLAVLFVFSAGAVAQVDYEIAGVETWTSNQVWNTNVVIKDGGTLNINPGCSTVGIHYVDLNGDGIGDVKLIVEDGGTLNINSDVTFSATGAAAPDDTKHWYGVQFQSENVSITGSLTIEDAYSALELSKATDLSGVTISNSTGGFVINDFPGSFTLSDFTLNDMSGTAVTVNKDSVNLGGFTINGSAAVGAAIEVNAANVGIFDVDIDDADKGVVFNAGNGVLKYGELTNIADNAVELNGNNILVSWIDVDTAGTGFYVNGTGIDIQNSYAKDGTQSGLFNDGGEVTVYNSEFSNNAFHGVVNNEGTLEMYKSIIYENTGVGFVAAGNGSSNVYQVTDSANVSYGAQITQAAFASDALAVPSGAGTVPTVSFRFSNLVNNNTGAAGDSTQVYSAGDETNVADFTGNWWDYSTGIGDLVQVEADSSVDYSNWRTAGELTDAKADFTPTKSISFDNLYSNDVLYDAQEFTMKWSTAGDIPRIDIASVGVLGGPSETNMPNYGEYAFTPSTWAGVTVSLTENGGSTTTSVTGLTSSAAASIVVNYPDGGETIAAYDTIKVRWAASSSVEDVKIELDADGDATYETVIASSVDAALGEYTYVVGDLISGAADIAGANAIVKITDLGGSTNDVSDAAFTIEPRPDYRPGGTWHVDSSSVMMTVRIADVDIVDELGAPILAVEGGDYFVGAFFTNADGDEQCAGWSRLVGGNSHDDDAITDVVDGGVAADSDPVILTIYGDDPITAEVEGYSDTDQLRFKLWRYNWATDDEDPDAIDVHTRTVVAGQDAGSAVNDLPLTFVTGGIINGEDGNVPLGGDDLELIYQRGAASSSIAEHLVPVRTPNTTLNPGSWTLISSYIRPTNAVLGYLQGGAADVNILSEPAGVELAVAGAPAAGDQGVLQDVNEDGDAVVADGDLVDWAAATDFVMLKNDLGQVYWNIAGGTDMTAGIDQLSNAWDYREGYMLKIADASAVAQYLLRFIGPKAAPQNTPIALREGWNLVPYLRDNDLAVELGLSSIAGYLRIAKDGDGKVYWPAYSINDIGDMEPGYAYWVNVEQAINLTYPSNSYTPKAAPENRAPVEPQHFVVDFNSDNSAVVGVLESAFSHKMTIGDEIGIFNSRGDLVGSMAYGGGNMATAVWGLESGKEEGRGMKVGEGYEFRYWSKATGEETVLKDVKFVVGANSYEKDGVAMVSKASGEIAGAIPTEFELTQNYPNPFNPATTIKFALPADAKVTLAVYNILGQQVATLVNEQMSAGYHTVEWSAAHVASGIYFYRIQAGNFTMTKKMNLLK